MGEDDYSSGVTAALKTLDDIIASLSAAPRLTTRERVIDCILEVITGLPTSAPVRHRAVGAIEDAQEIIDRTVEDDIDTLLASRSDAAGILVSLEKANVLMRTMHSGSRQISVLGKIRERERVAKARQDEVRKRLDEPRRDDRTDGGR